jgi:hypothetical protein
MLPIATDDDTPEPEASPERQLLVAVLVQALRDLRDRRWRVRVAGSWTLSFVALY